MKPIPIRLVAVGVALALAFVLTETPAWSATSVYIQTNLVSDIPGLAQSTDPNLKNPWGVSFSATGAFWVSDAATNLSTLYQGTGSTINARVVSVPGGPTGEVVNAVTTDFIEANGRSASFIFSTLDGSIYAWNANNTNNVAQQMTTVANASFTGLAIASNGTANFIYASNISGTGSIEVFNASFARVTSSFPFKDPNLPPPPVSGQGYVPYNIQNINNQLYVEYANFQLNTGALAIFDANGGFVKELIPAGGPQLNLPWGVVIAPANFGTYANQLLVGNLGNGQINAFDPTTGAFQGTLQGFNGPIANSGLWALSTRSGGTFDTSAVFITAGLNNQVNGLLAKINAVTPATVAITTGALPAGTINTLYSQTLAVTGGTAPYSNWTVTAGNLPPGLSLNSKTGTLSGTPTAIGGTYSFMVSVTDSTGATGSTSFQMTVQTPSSATPLARVGSFAQVASGGGWKTSMTLINLTAAPVNAQVNFYADTGKAASLPVTFPQFVSGTLAQSVNMTIGPNDSIVVTTNASGSGITVGWADVQATGPLSGYSTFAFTTPGIPDSEGTSPLDNRQLSSMLIPFDNTNGYQTGLALANQSSSAQTATVTLLDQNGLQIASSQINLPAFGHSAFFVGTQFVQSANQLGIIQVQSNGGVTGVGLRFSPTGSFTSIPIIR